VNYPDLNIIERKTLEVSEQIAFWQDENIKRLMPKFFRNKLRLVKIFAPVLRRILKIEVREIRQPLDSNILTKIEILKDGKSYAVGEWRIKR
jgi:hypothetical protein